MRDRFCKFVIIIILSYIRRAFSGHFWHISDLHINYSYVVGGNISDLCRKSKDKAANVTGQELVGPAGNYHCDSPLVLAKSALDAMKKIHGDPDFILWMGDSTPHWNTPTSSDMTYIINVTQTVFTELEHLFPGVPIIPVLGNHDVSPPNQFPISTTRTPVLSITPACWNMVACFLMFQKGIVSERSRNVVTMQRLSKQPKI
jgi:hypothetical protein